MYCIQLKSTVQEVHRIKAWLLPVQPQWLDIVNDLWPNALPSQASTHGIRVFFARGVFCISSYPAFLRPFRMRLGNALDE